MHRLQELVRLHRMGRSVREVARLLRMSPTTERKYREALVAEELLEGAAEALPDAETLRAAVLRHHPPQTPEQEQSSLAAWEPQVQALMADGLKPRAIFDRLRLERSDFEGSYWAVKRMVRRLSKEAGPRAEEVAIPVETTPGEVAQVDFGYVGRLIDPATQTARRAWVFVMVLGHSRHLFARVVFDQKARTWLQLHAEAFRWFGGAPRTIVPDNLKAAVVRASFGVDGPTALNRSYRELARHHGFLIDPTPPYAPNKKGKVEAAVKYVKRNFFAGRDGQDAREVNALLDRWVVEVAGQRVHGTTRQQPLEVFETEERGALLPLRTERFELIEWKEAKVHPDCCITFDRRQYSAPWRLVGRTVWVRATTTSVMIYFDDERVGTHPRRGTGIRSIDEAHLPEHRRDLRHRSRDYWVERAARMGEDVRVFIEEVFDSDDVLSQLRTAQAIVTHLEKYPLHRAQAACRRASYYGNTSYRGLKQILARALDLEPLPVAVLPGKGALDAPRFARPLTDLLNFTEDTTDERH